MNEKSLNNNSIILFIIILYLIPLISCRNRTEEREAFNYSNVIASNSISSELYYFAGFERPLKNHRMSLGKEQGNRNDIINHIKEKLNIKLYVIDPYRLTDIDLINLRSKDKSTNFSNYTVGTINNSMDRLQKMLDNQLLDIVHFKDYVLLEDTVDMSKYFTEVDDLIKKYAPNIYSAFPEKYWKYRKIKGIKYGIPVRIYKPLADSGVWMIKKKGLTKKRINTHLSKEEVFVLLVQAMLQKKKVKEFQSLDSWRINSRKTGIDSIDSLKAMQDILTNSLIAVSKSQEKFLAAIVGIITNPAGYTEFNAEEYILRKYTDAEVENIRRIDTLIEGAVIAEDVTPFNKQTDFSLYFGYMDWYMAYLPFNFAFPDISQNELERFITLFDSKENIIICDAEFLVNNLFDTYDYLYIPKSSINKETVLKLLDHFWGSDYWHDVLNYGMDVTKSTHFYKDIINVDDWSYYNNLNHLKSPLSILTDQKEIKIPAFFPDTVVNSFSYAKRQYINQSHALNGFDIFRSYHEIKNKLIHEGGFGYFTNKLGGITSILDGSYEWKEKYIDRMIPEMQKAVNEYLKMEY